MSEVVSSVCAVADVNSELLGMGVLCYVTLRCVVLCWQVYDTGRDGMD
jgi:hypothetical protein